jgi:hypothetical protein
MAANGEPVVFEAFGVTAAVHVEDPAQRVAIPDLLPPASRRGDPDQASASFLLTVGGEVRRDGRQLTTSGVHDGALAALEAELRAFVALNAPERVFVHAGAVEYRGRAIVLPGGSFTGKTTLVAELVRAGATYMSDEFAVLDDAGLVHPYPKPLSMRRPGAIAQTDIDAADLGRAAATESVPVGIIASLSYWPGSPWDPTPRAPATGALALISNAVPARERSDRVLAAAARAAAPARVLEGSRGEAPIAAAALLSAAMDL